MRIRSKIIVFVIFSSLFFTFCTTKVKIKPLRNFEIPYNKAGNWEFNFCKINDEQYYVYLDKIGNKCLYIRNIEDNKLLFSVSLINIFEKYPMQIDDMTSESVCIHSLDSIFVLGSEDRFILLINNKGDIKKTYNLKNKLFPENIPYVLQSFGNAPFLEINKNEFICRTIRMIYVGSKEGRLAYYNLPTVGKITINNDSANIKAMSIFFPFEIRKSGEDYIDMWAQYTLNKNNDILYSFSFSPFLYIINKEKTDSIKIISKYFSQKDIIPVDSLSYFKNIYEYTLEYLSKTPSYPKIIYNPYQNIYFRIAKHSKKYKNSDGTLNKAENWSIIFLNADFTILDEIPFLNDSIYNWKIFIPTKKGFIIGMQQTDEDKENEKLRLCEFEVKL